MHQLVKTIQAVTYINKITQMTISLTSFFTSGWETM